MKKSLAVPGRNNDAVAFILIALAYLALDTKYEFYFSTLFSVAFEVLENRVSLMRVSYAFPFFLFRVKTLKQILLQLQNDISNIQKNINAFIAGICKIVPLKVVAGGGKSEGTFTPIKHIVRMEIFTRPGYGNCEFSRTIFIRIFAIRRRRTSRGFSASILMRFDNFPPAMRDPLFDGAENWK